jgi:uncharacterized protein YndB with AHSA1/START domain
MTDTGALGTFPDKHTFRLELTYPHPPSRVWKAITAEENLAVWFMPLELELRVDGHAVLKDYGQPAGVPPARGTVTVVEAERLLEYHFGAGAWEWPESTLRFELTAENGGCRLVFTQRLAPDSVPEWRGFAKAQIAGPGTHLPGACAGWQGFFQEGLGRDLDGRVTDVYGPDDDVTMAQRAEAYEPMVRQLII